MKTNRVTKISVASGIVLFVVGGLGFWLLQPREVPVEQQAAGAPGAQQVLAQRATRDRPIAGSATGAVQKAAQQQVAAPKRAEKPASPMDTNEVVNVADRAAAEKMRERLDSEDEAGALVFARKLLKSEDVEVRNEVVTVLGWIGVKALPELSQMLGDTDEAVAEDAYSQWKNAVGDVADDALKGQLLTTGMLTMTEKATLENCVMGFDQLPEDVSVRSLVTIINSDNPVASDVARDHYEFVTGDKFTSAPDAEKWISENTVREGAAPVKP